MTHFFISGVRSTIGGHPFLQINREGVEGGKDSCEALVFYSDRKPGDHAESYRLANAMVRGLNEFYSPALAETTDAGVR